MEDYYSEENVKARVKALVDKADEKNMELLRQRVEEGMLMTTLELEVEVRDEIVKALGRKECVRVLTEFYLEEGVEFLDEYMEDTEESRELAKKEGRQW